jgi:phosphoadenosine phosphosulfate reductase
MRKELEKKVSQSVRLLQVCYKTAGEPLEIAYSGGKDSDVILELAKMAGIKYRAIYKNTTIDPPGTIKHARENGVEVRRPVKSFFELMAEKGLPNRNYRFCCDVLKEYKILDNTVIGIRRCESTKRAKRYNEPTECRFFGSKKNHVNQIYPILDWSDED